jgi:predicted aminopeptidase
MRIMHARHPIVKLLATDTLSPERREKLEMVQAVRAFAIRELGLPDSRSYTQLAEIPGDYPGWNVFCAPEFSVEPKTWCYPVAGCVVYHGYFKKEKAVEFAEKMKKEGFDVYISPFSAYSTLGWFSDPILSSNLRDDSVDLAGLIIHEMAHQKYYKSGDSQFSEGFAMTVERAGVLRWLKELGHNDQAARAIRDWEAYDRRVDRMLAVRNELAVLYDSGRDTSFMRVRKDSILRALEGELGLKSGRLSNAALVPVSTYHSLIAGFQATLDSCGGDFRKFYEAVKK